jgi:hypothetical protein
MRRFASVIVVSLLVLAAACGGGGGTSGAEDSARHLYEKSRTLNGLESNLEGVSCTDSTTPEPTDQITLYDCTLRFQEGDAALWCLVEGSVRTAPLPVACGAIPREALTGGS